MKNNLKTKILLSATAIIWIAVAIMLFNNFGSEEIDTPESVILSHFQPKKEKEKDTFSITTVSRDPFLGTVRTNNKTTQKYIKTKVKAPKKQLPKITFVGVIRNKETSKQVFLVNINNTQFSLKKGQTVEGVKVLKGNAKEIVVTFNANRLTIPIQ